MKLLTVFGTRPEAIKMAPLIHQLDHSRRIRHSVCTTGQHLQMLRGTLRFFRIRPDYELHIMKPRQAPTDIAIAVLKGLSSVFRAYRPDWVLVHGDTTSCLAASLAAFYARIRVAHVEAGLRTHHLFSPFPEEANRLTVDRLSSVHFAPTERNRQNLINEGIAPESIFVTGNTVVDALQWSLRRIKGFSNAVPENIRRTFESRVLLITCHRRENHGEGVVQICKALLQIARKYPFLQLVYPVHLNPCLQKPARTILSGVSNIHLMPPLDYPDFVYAMRRCWLILTDSGGIQEEASVLGKPVLLTRYATERPEMMETGNMVLVGADCSRITQVIDRLWSDPLYYSRMAQHGDLYGDGHASERITGFFDRLALEKTGIAALRRSPGRGAGTSNKKTLY